MYNTLKVRYEGKVATLCLTRGAVGNTIFEDVADDFVAALEEIGDSDAEVVILAAEGESFCSGINIEALDALTLHSAEDNESQSRRIATMFLSLYEFPKITIAVVQGHALAGGAMLALLCDFTLAEPETEFGFPEARIGFAPALVSPFLRRQIGEKLMRDLLLTGRMISAEEAHVLGMVTRIAPAADLMKEAKLLALQLLECAPSSLRETKALLVAEGREELLREVENGITANGRIRKGADFAEGVRSLLEHRKPHWR